MTVNLSDGETKMPMKPREEALLLALIFIVMLACMAVGFSAGLGVTPV